MPRLVLISLAAIVLGCSLRLFAAAETVKVDGGQIVGVEVEGVRMFKGIPFAAPPVGDLRWKPPQPVVPWTGVRKADTFGPKCDCGAERAVCKRSVLLASSPGGERIGEPVER